MPSHEQITEQILKLSQAKSHELAPWQVEYVVLDSLQTILAILDTIVTNQEKGGEHEVAEKYV